MWTDPCFRGKARSLLIYSVVNYPETYTFKSINANLTFFFKKSKKCTFTEVKENQHTMVDLK